MKPLTKEWIQRAKEYYRVTIRESKAIPANHATVCFHAQQAIEK